MKKPTGKPQGTTGRESDKFILRMPVGMRDKIAARAAENGRSMNSEIIALIERQIEGEDRFASEIYGLIEGLQEQLKKERSRTDRLEERFTGKFQFPQD